MASSVPGSWRVRHPYGVFNLRRRRIGDIDLCDGTTDEIEYVCPIALIVNNNAARRLSRNLIRGDVFQIVTRITAPGPATSGAPIVGIPALLTVRRKTASEFCTTIHASAPSGRQKHRNWIRQEQSRDKRRIQVDALIQIERRLSSHIGIGLCSRNFQARQRVVHGHEALRIRVKPKRPIRRRPVLTT